MSETNTERFVIDANSFIEPFQKYYSQIIVPSYWKILSANWDPNRLFVLDVVNAEITNRDDWLSNWLSENIENTSTKTQSTVENYGKIMRYIHNCGYYTDAGIKTWAESSTADPWLIAYAMANDCTVVTFEIPAGSGLNIKNKSNKIKIPDVANHFGVRYVSLFYMMEALNIVI